MSIGQLDKADLLVKIQSLCFRLEQTLDSQSLHRSPNSLDEAKERLRYLMLRRYPRLVYIFDDMFKILFIYLLVFSKNQKEMGCGCT